MIQESVLDFIPLVRHVGDASCCQTDDSLKSREGCLPDLVINDNEELGFADKRKEKPSHLYTLDNKFVSDVFFTWCLRENTTRMESGADWVLLRG